jgi:hypothetical protein
MTYIYRVLFWLQRCVTATICVCACVCMQAVRCPTPCAGSIPIRAAHNSTHQHTHNTTGQVLDYWRGFDSHKGRTQQHTPTYTQYNWPGAGLLARVRSVQGPGRSNSDQRRAVALQQTHNIRPQIPPWRAAGVFAHMTWLLCLLCRVCCLCLFMPSMSLMSFMTFVTLVTFVTFMSFYVSCDFHVFYVAYAFHVVNVFHNIYISYVDG